MIQAACTLLTLSLWVEKITKSNFSLTCGNNNDHGHVYVQSVNETAGSQLGQTELGGSPMSKGQSGSENDKQRVFVCV